MFYFLQISSAIADSTAKVVANAIPVAEKISMWQLLQKGGFIMYPLYFLLLITIFVFVERLIAITKASKIDSSFMKVIRDNIVSGNISAARNLAKNTDNPVARMIDQRTYY